jgi:hypothetical protein
MAAGKHVFYVCMSVILVVTLSSRTPAGIWHKTVGIFSTKIVVALHTHVSACLSSSMVIPHAISIINLSGSAFGRIDVMATHLRLL